MVTWIIDDGPLEHLASVVDPASMTSWPKDQFVVADSTAQAASGRRKRLLGITSPIKEFTVTFGSKGFEILYQHLREPTTADKNLAEHQSIAWALSERPDAVLVAQDKGAAFLALAELGRGGAAHPTELWIFLRNQQLVTANEFEKLCERTKESDQSKIPLRCKP